VRLRLKNTRDWRVDQKLVQIPWNRTCHSIHSSTQSSSSSSSHSVIHSCIRGPIHQPIHSFIHSFIHLCYSFTFPVQAYVPEHVHLVVDNSRKVLELERTAAFQTGRHEHLMHQPIHFFMRQTCVCHLHHRPKQHTVTTAAAAAAANLPLLLRSVPRRCSKNLDQSATGSDVIKAEASISLHGWGGHSGQSTPPHYCPPLM